MASQLQTCFICEEKKADESLKSDLPTCLTCYKENAARFQEFKETRYEIGKKFPCVSEIIPGKLYLGNEDAASIEDEMTTRKITHILVAGSHLSQYHPKKFTYLQLELDDSLQQEISQYFQTSFDFIEDATVAYIHCAAGVSRSATIVISYIMKKFHLSFNEAFQRVKSARNIICPNSNFQNQLRQYQEKLFIKDQ